MEYREFAKYYDVFYQKKDYEKEVEFLLEFIRNGDSIVDIGCGTGVHGGLLSKRGFNVDGVDLNKEMLDIAASRLSGEVYQQNMLELDLGKKYDIVISMFAVVNHLNDIESLLRMFRNFREILKDEGIIIIDLHNPQDSGEKCDSYGNITRIMKWNFDKKTRYEKSSITFRIDNVLYEDAHTFRIFTIDEVNGAAKKVGLKVIKICENYDINIVGNERSKNLQFIIKKS